MNRLKDLVSYCVNRINIRTTSALVTNVCPRVRFTGRKVNYKSEFSLSFGDYVEVYDPKVLSNSVIDMRTEPCIALYPAANITGSWIFWNLKTRSYVRRTRWKKMVMADTIIETLNNISGQSGIKSTDVSVEEDIVIEETVQDAQEPIQTHVPFDPVEATPETIGELEAIENE